MLGYITINNEHYQILDFDIIKGTCYGFIYVTTNTLTGKRYLGMHTTWKKTYKGSGTYLKHALAKYGEDNFTRHIIDTANTYEELAKLEKEYIEWRLGINIAESTEWYNITSGIQRGGNTWAGLTKDDREKRIAKIRAHNLGRKSTPKQVEANRARALKRFSDPLERDKTSQATKLGMTKEVRDMMSKSRRGVVPRLTISQREALSLQGRRNAEANPYFRSTTAWNKGVPQQTEVREAISKTTRKSYDVYLDSTPIYINLSVRGGWVALTQELQKRTGVEVGKNKLRECFVSGISYRGVTVELCKQPDQPPTYRYARTHSYSTAYLLYLGGRSIGMVDGGGAKDKLKESVEKLTGVTLTRAQHRDIINCGMSHKGVSAKEVKW